MKRIVLILGGSSRIGRFERLIGNALSRLGLKVIYLCYEDYLGSKASVIRRLLSSNMGYKLVRNNRFIRKFNSIIINCCSKINPDIIMIVKGEFLYPDTVKLLRRICSSTMLYYNTDDPRYSMKYRTGDLMDFLQRRFTESILEHMDLVLTPSPICTILYRKAGYRAIELPFACSPEVHKISHGTIRKYPIVVFAGTLWPRRLYILRKLVGNVPLLIYTSSKTYGIIPKRIVRPGVWGKKYALVNAICKVSLNIHLQSDIGWKANMRVFEVPCAGGILLTDNDRIVKRYFTINSEVFCWSSIEDLIEVSKWILSLPDDDVHKISLKAQIKALREHTYDNRAKILLKAIR